MDRQESVLTAHVKAGPALEETNFYVFGGIFLLLIQKACDKHY